MKSVLLSVQPKWCKLICSGEKTVEVRKNRPNCELPFKCYIYCTKGKPTFSQSAFCDEVSNGKIIGEFVCDRIDKGILRKSEFFDSVNITHDKTCVSLDEFEKYLGAKEFSVNLNFMVGTLPTWLCMTSRGSCGVLNENARNTARIILTAPSVIIT